MTPGKEIFRRIIIFLLNKQVDYYPKVTPKKPKKHLIKR